jgi:hypothetical protein
LLDGNLSYYGKHSYAAVRVKPMGFGWTSDDSVFNAMFLAEGGYDGRAFAVGVGAGVGITSGRMQDALNNSDELTNSSSSDKKAAFAMSQHVRIGPKDGLNLMVYNSFLYATKSLSTGEDVGFTFGSTVGRINCPLGYRLTLFTAGGGGRLGFAFGELGVFIWAKGNGDAGSIGFSGAIGAAGVWARDVNGSEDENDNSLLLGPMVSFGFTHRFGRSTQTR